MSVSTVIIALQALTEMTRQAQAISMLLARHHAANTKPSKEELREVTKRRDAALAAFEAELDGADPEPEDGT